MKNFFLLTIYISIYSNLTAQNSLQETRGKILKRIEILQDSLKLIDLEIQKKTTAESLKNIKDSVIIAYTINNAKLRETPFVGGKLLKELSANTRVTVLDYYDGFWGVCTDSICGYINEVWLIENHKTKKLKEIRDLEKITLEKVKEEIKQKKDITDQKEAEKKYLKKYGSKLYAKLKEGKFWIGMTDEMAIISLGLPNDINRTVLRWGVHEQWVYDKVYLYFENGILTAYQN